MAENTLQNAEGNKSLAQETTRAQDRYIAPPVDIYESKSGLRVVADLPGADPDSIEVKTDQGVLTIQARTRHLATGEPTRSEFKLVNFFRQFQLPDKISVNDISADYQNGVLRLALPWAPEIQPRKIEVKAV